MRRSAFIDERSKIARKQLRHEHPDVARMEQNLGHALVEAGRGDEAREYFLRALDHTSAALGPTHRRVAEILRDLGRLRTDRGELAQAVETFERELEIREAAMGTDHPSVTTTRVDLARARFGAAKAIIQDDRSAALALVRAALEATRRRDSRVEEEVQIWRDSQF